MTATDTRADASGNPPLTQRLPGLGTDMAVALALLLPGVFVVFWQFAVACELRMFGRYCEDRELSRISPARTLLAMTVGWLLVLPALIQLVLTSGRVARAERRATETSEPVGSLIAVIVACELVALVSAVAVNAAILVPVSIWIAGVVEVAFLHPRFRRVWGELPRALPVAAAPVDPTRLPTIEVVVRSWAVWQWMGSSPARQRVLKVLAWVVGSAVVLGAGYAVYMLARLLIGEDRTGTFAGIVTTASVIGASVGLSLALGWALRALAEGRAQMLLAGDHPVDSELAAVGALAVLLAGLWLWSARPLFHGLVMAFYQWPLVTWIPIVLGLLFTALCVPAAVVAGRRPHAGLRAGVVWRTAVTVVLWLVFLALLPGWTGRALYDATVYAPGSLPFATQPRLLPKAAALTYAQDSSLHDAHLVVDPATGRLVWSAERAGGGLRTGRSQGYAILPIDRVDGTEQLSNAGFRLAVSRVGPGSLQWRGYDRHYFTRVQDAVIVPLPGGGALAVAPYIGYRGFPVRHPYWAGVYVLHQDGRLEDLTPSQALARPELAASGRLFPERLARSIATAYGYRSGAGAVWLGRPRTEVSDPSGNPQPYLTNLGGGVIDWVSVAHSSSDPNIVAAIFLTNASTGATEVWTPPRGERLLSNTGAIALVQALPLQWEGCCDGNGNSYWLRKAVEPTPVFAKGHLYYLVSVIPNGEYLSTPQPVDQTVLVDAQSATVIGQYDHSDPSADAQLRAFFEAAQ